MKSILAVSARTFPQFSLHDSALRRPEKSANDELQLEL